MHLPLICTNAAQQRQFFCPLRDENLEGIRNDVARHNHRNSHKHTQHGGQRRGIARHFRNLMLRLLVASAHRDVGSTLSLVFYLLCQLIRGGVACAVMGSAANQNTRSVFLGFKTIQQLRHHTNLGETHGHHLIFLRGNARDANGVLIV